MWLDEEINQELLNHNLDAIDERYDNAQLLTAFDQQKVAQYYNKNIRVRTFKIGDWVLRRVFQNTKEVGTCKLGPNWEGPYKITKKQLKKAKGLWADELPGVLWAYQTTFTGETPFSLAYGTEAVILVECGITFTRYMWLDEDTNQELLNHSLDVIEKLRDKAHLRTAFY